MRQIRNFTLQKTYLLVVGILLAMSFRAEAQMTLSGSETLVNSTTSGNQSRPEVAMDASGNYVVVWESWGQDGEYYGIYFQRYDNTGTPVGIETLVNNTTEFSQREPDVAMAADGKFVVSWQSQFEDTDGWGVWFALYDNTGTLIQRSRVNDSSADEQQHARVAMSYDGNFVVGYADDGQDGDGWGVSFQGFSSTGVAQFAEVVPNTTTSGYQSMPDVAMDSTGNYLWVWQAENQDGDGLGIYGQWYDDNNNTVGSETLINTTTAGNQQEPAVAMDYDGNAFVVWSSYAQDGDHYGVVGQLYNASGTAIGGEIAINTTTASAQSNANVSATKDGWIVSWVSYNQDGDVAGVYAQLIAPDGSMLGSEESINTTTANYQMFPGVGSNPNSEDATIAWQSGAYNNTSTQDGDEYGVYYQRYTVEDTENPVANCQDITVYLDGSGNVSITAGDVDNGSTDNYGIVSYDIDVSSFTCANIGGNTVTLTVTDAAGNSDNCTSTVTVLDTVSPSAVCQNLTVYLDGSGNASITTGDVDNGSTDNCSVASLALDISSFTCSDVGSVAVTLTVTDGSGNISTCSSTVTVLDTVSPSAVCQNLTVYLDGSGNATITGADLDGGSTDNCSGTLSFSADITSFTCANIGSNTVTMTVTDPGGNMDDCTATVTILDTVSPTASCQDITAYLDGSGNVSITTGDVDNGSSDNCSVASLALDVSSFTCANAGANTVTLTVTDGSGNVSTCTSTVTVADTISPTITCPGNQNEFADASCNVSLPDYTGLGSASDNCGSATITQSPVAGTTLSGAGTVQTVTLTATDGSGNTTSCTFDVTVVDNTAPTITCPGDQNEFADASCDVSLPDYTGLATVADNCDASPTVTQSPVAGTTLSGAGTVQTVTLTVTDASGNSSNCTFDVTVIDNTAPTITCPGDQNEFADASCDVSLPDYTGLATVADNCDASPTVTQSPVAGTTLSGAGTVQTVTLTVTDASGNSSNCTFDVTVIDNTAPTITCPGDQNEFADASCDVSLPDYTGLATVADNCDASPTVTQSPVAGTTLSGAGTVQTVTLTVTDASGNSSNCTFDVTVIDNTAPTITCPGDQNEFADASCDVSLPDYTGLATVADNCDASPTVTQSPVAGTTLSGAGTVQTVTLTVTDASGNSSNCTFDVTVIDNTAPTITCPGDQNEFADASCDVSLPDYTGLATVADNCDASPTVTQSPVAGTTLSGAGTVQTVTLTVTDASGNSSNCTFDVTVIDNTAPTITCPGDQNEFADASCDVSLPDYTGLATVADNCDASPTVTQSPASGTTLSGAGTVQTVTLTVTDASGNSSNCTFDVTVIDNTAPTITCPGDQNEFADASCDVSLPDYTGLATVADNCDASPTVTQSPVAGTTLSGAGTVQTVTLTVTDASGNSSNCTFDVTVIDNTAPTITCPGDQNEFADASCDVSLPDYTGLATVADNCDASPTVTQSPVAGTILSGAGTVQTVTLTVTDASGNSSNCTFDVTVIDNTAPTITCPGDQFETPNASCQFTLPDYSSLATGADNCGTVTITQSPAPGTVISITTTLTLTADDGNGNTSDCTFDVSIIDNSDPVTPTLADITEECSATVTPPTTTDNCAGTITGTTTDPLTYTAQGTYTITWTFDDGNGNSITVPQTVTILDVTPPTASNPDTMYVECIADAVVDVNVVNDEADNCIATVTWNNDVVSGNGCQDTIIRTYTVSDDAGNSIDVTQVIIVEDITPPTVPVQGTVTVQCIDNFPGPDPNSVVGETDNCGTPTVAWVSDVSDGLSCPETITRTYSVTDNCGNSVLIDQLIMINDVSAPVPDSASLPMITQDCGDTPPAPTATDNCSGTISATSDVPLPLTTIGTTTVTWTFTDDCGNTATQTQDIVVNAFDVSTWIASDGITIVASNINPGVTYQWIDCSNNQPIPGETNHNFTPTYGGDFAVIITQNGCADTSACVNSTVGLDDLNGVTSLNLVIFPNPTTDGNFFIKLDGEWVGEVTLEMIDARGRLIYTEVTTNELVGVKIDDLQHGTYFIEARDEQDNVLTRRLVTIND